MVSASHRYCIVHRCLLYETVADRGLKNKISGRVFYKKTKKEQNKNPFEVNMPRYPVASAALRMLPPRGTLNYAARPPSRKLLHTSFFFLTKHLL